MKRRRDVFTTGEIAKLCRVAPRTVAKWFDSGRLKGYRIPGSQDRRVPVENLVRFMKENGMPLRELEEFLRYKVLLVAVDDKSDRRLRESLSAISDYSFEIVESAFDAGVLVTTFRPNAIVIDFSLGRRDAIQIVSKLRKSEARPSTLVIGLASEDEAEPEQLLQYGFNVVFKKPIDIAVVAKRIEIEKEAQR
jgi:two-component system response regulator RpaA